MIERIDPSLLPVLLVVGPLLTAALVLAVGRRIDSAGVVLALFATASNAVMALALARATLVDDRRVRTEIGGFPAEQGGIELLVDGFSALVVVLIAVVGVAILVAGLDERRSHSFYALYVLLIAGLSGLAVTNDVFNMYVFLEISGLAAYALIASDGSGSSALAALKYLIVGTVGASLYLIGVGYAYVATGYLNMVQLADAFAELGYTDPLVQSAFALIAAGFAIKIALFPVHTWQPDAYTEAPDRMTALIAALVSTTAAYALARVSLDVFTPAFFAANPVVHDLLLAVAAASVIAGSVLAVLQSEVKRMLAYSSVSQFGLVVVGIFLLNEEALVGSIIHLIGHAIIKAGLFLGVAAFAAAYGVRTVDEYDGLAQRAPWASAAVAVLAIALVGIPPTVGFVGKLYIAIGAVEADSWGLVAVIVTSTVLTLGYVLRLLERMYFTEPAELSTPPASADLATDGGGAPGESATEPGASPTDTVASPPTGRISLPLLIVVVVAAISVVVLGLSGAWLDSQLGDTVGVLLE